MRLFAIRCLDFVDDFVLNHRFPWYCDRVSNSRWWEQALYKCEECGAEVADGFFGSGHQHWE
jgi:hypothetical protein